MNEKVMLITFAIVKILSVESTITIGIFEFLQSVPVCLLKACNFVVRGKQKIKINYFEISKKVIVGFDRL